jgi:hypothetical protein
MGHTFIGRGDAKNYINSLKMENHGKDSVLLHAIAAFAVPKGVKEQWTEVRWYPELFWTW